MVYICGCIPACIKQALAELPDTLDETYERTLREINKADWEFAHRLFQFVAVAARPLCVEELAELLAVDFKAGPIPKFHEGWRLPDPADVVLSKCSSLLVIVDGGSLAKTADDESLPEAVDSNNGPRSDSSDSVNTFEAFKHVFFPEGADDRFHFGKVIQFSHYSVKEFLTSTRLAQATDDILRRHHVSMTPAHILVAQACLGILLHLDEDVVTSDGLEKWPLAYYAARHWIFHVRFQDVSRNVVDGMKRLFDPRKTYLRICFQICNTDLSQRTRQDKNTLTLPGTPLHFASLWGFDFVVVFLIIERSQDVNSQSFPNRATPLLLASASGHSKVACILIDRGADLKAKMAAGIAPLHVVSRVRRVEIARMLIERGADLTVQDETGATPLFLASSEGDVEVTRMLIEHGADVTTQNRDGRTPLQAALFNEQVEVARMLIEHGADLIAPTIDGVTPLHAALYGQVGPGQVELVRMFIERDADATAQNKDRATALHVALQRGQVDVAHMLIEHGADVTVQDKDGATPLHLALNQGQVEVARMLIERGADVTVQNKDGVTPLHLVSNPSSSFLEPQDRAATHLEHGADVNSENADRLTSFRLASQRGLAEVTTRALLEHGADHGEMSVSENLPVTPSPAHTHTDLSTLSHPSLETPNFAVTDSQTQTPSCQPPSDDAPPDRNRHPVFFSKHLIFSLVIVAIAVVLIKVSPQTLAVG